MGTAAPAPACGPAAGAAPGPAEQRPRWPRVAAWPPRLSHSRAEQTVCRNCFLSANSLEITNPSPGPGAPRRGAWSSAWARSVGRREHCPKETLSSGCDRAVRPTAPKRPHTPHRTRTTVLCVPRDGVGRGEEGTALPCARSGGRRNQPQQPPAPSPAWPDSNRRWVGLVTAAETHHQMRIVYKRI